MSNEFLIHLNQDITSAQGKDVKDKRRALKETCQEFESLFIQQLLTEMRKAVPKSDLLGERREEEMYQSLYDEELAVQMSKQRGLGLADLLFEQLKAGLNDESGKSDSSADAGQSVKSGEEPVSSPSNNVARKEKIG